MAQVKLGLWHYLKAAFNARVSVKGLGRVPVNWLALVGLGVAAAAAWATLSARDKRGWM